MFDVSKNSKSTTEHGGIPVNSATEDEITQLQPDGSSELSASKPSPWDGIWETIGNPAQDGVSSSISSLCSSSSSSTSIPSSSSSRSFPSSISSFSPFPFSSASSISHRYTEETCLQNPGKPPLPKSQSYAELIVLKNPGKIVPSPSTIVERYPMASQVSLSGFASSYLPENPAKHSQPKSSISVMNSTTQFVSYYRLDQHLYPPKPAQSSQDDDTSAISSSQQDHSLQNRGQASSSSSSSPWISQHKSEKHPLQDQQYKSSTFVASSTPSHRHGNIWDASSNTRDREQASSFQHTSQTTYMHNNPRENSSRFAGSSLSLSSSQQRLQKYSYTFDSVQTSSRFTASSSSSSQAQQKLQKDHGQTSASSTLVYASSKDPSPFSSSNLSTTWNEYQASSSSSMPTLDPPRHSGESSNVWNVYPEQVTSSSSLRPKTGQLRQDSWSSQISMQCMMLSVISLCILTVILVVLPLYLPPLPPPPMELMMLPVVIFMLLICVALFPQFL